MNCHFWRWRLSNRIHPKNTTSTLAHFHVTLIFTQSAIFRHTHTHTHTHTHPGFFHTGCSPVLFLKITNCVKLRVTEKTSVCSSLRVVLFSMLCQPVSTNTLPDVPYSHNNVTICSSIQKCSVFIYSKSSASSKLSDQDISFCLVLRILSSGVPWMSTKLTGLFLLAGLFYFMPVSVLARFATVLVCTGACNSCCELISAKHTALKKDDVKFPDCVSSPATKVVLDFFWSNDCVRRVCFLACSLPQPIHHQCTLFQWGDRNRQ